MYLVVKREQDRHYIIGVYSERERAEAVLSEEYNETCFQIEQEFLGAGPEKAAKYVIDDPDYKSFMFDGCFYSWELKEIYIDQEVYEQV